MWQRAFIAGLHISLVYVTLFGILYTSMLSICHLSYALHFPMCIKPAGLINVFSLYIVNCLLWNDMSKHVALIMRPTVIEFVVCDGSYGTCEYCEQNLAWLLFLAVSALPS